MKNRFSFLFLLLLLGFSVFAQDGVYNIKDFGAIDDSTLLSTKAIQSAIDKCSEGGGGKVIVPPGNYLTNALFLKSNICFEVFPGATLFFDDNISSSSIVEGRWEGIERKVYASLFTGHNLKNVTITGRGTINGQGKAWWDASKINKSLRKKYNIQGREPHNPSDSPLKAPRPRMINLYNCTNVLISDLTILNSPSWTIHPVYCENITIEGISIIQPYESPNTDGINPESCKNVRIFNCFVDCGDDCITIKSGYNEDGRRVGIPCENIVISNCTFAHGRSAIGIGSEMSGGIKNVTISNCVFNGTLRGLRIKTGRGRGGIVENYRADNIVMTNVETAISIDMYYGNKGEDNMEAITEKTPFFKNIHLSNITAINVENAAQIIGLPEAPILDFSITNSNFTSESGFEIKYVRNIALRDVKVNCIKGNALDIKYGKDITIDNFGTGAPLKNEAVVNLQNNDDVYLLNCKATPDTDIFLKSTDTQNLNFGTNWFNSAKVLK